MYNILCTQQKQSILNYIINHYFMQILKFGLWYMKLDYGDIHFAVLKFA